MCQEGNSAQNSNFYEDFLGDNRLIPLNRKVGAKDPTCRMAGKETHRSNAKILVSGRCAINRKNPALFILIMTFHFIYPPPGRAGFFQSHWGRGGVLAITVAHNTLPFTESIYTSTKPNQQPAPLPSTAGAWLRPINF